MKTVIVVFGNAAAGKDTLAEMIAACLRPHGSTLRLAFADPLKEAALHLLGIPPEVSYADAKVKESWKAYGKTARHWLQWIGTEIGRDQIHRDVWIHRLGDRVARDPAQFAVVSDGRFENERTKLADYMNQAKPGEYRVRNVLVYRPDYPVKTEHPSEAEVFAMRMRATTGVVEPLFDMVIRNAGSLDDLAADAQRVVKFVTEM